MAATIEVAVQNLLHSLEQGRIAIFVRIGAFVVLIVALTLLYLFVQFRGFATVTAMDQAQIARNIANGKGITTNFIRPLAIWQLEQSEKEIPGDLFPDFYQSPLNPLVNALPLAMVKPSWKMKPLDFIYQGDRAIAFVSIIFFLLSVLVWYFIGAQLFDSKLSAWACAIILLTDMMWQFSLSGLPQMLMLLLFSGVAGLTIFAMQKRDSLILLLAALFGIGILFGLMVLAHGLASWMFIGWLVFALFYFRPRGVSALVAVAGLLIVVLPWLARNYSVCGNPLGLSIYSMMTWEFSPETGYLRSLEGTPDITKMYPLAKIRTGVLDQASKLFSFLGINLAAVSFFLALLHPFRSPTAALFRWSVLLMWASALIGMTLFGVTEPISSNQLHVLFIPIFVLYGLSLLMVLWNRWDLRSPILRTIFLVTIVLLCAAPMLFTLFAGRQKAIQWPPYVPPFIGVLGDWFEENEIIASDMPWAVAWYAQRKSLLLPETVAGFNQISDYNILGNSINGLYLTPVTGNLALFSGIYKGPYKGWIPIITRPPRVEGFALSYYTILPIEGECIIFADRDRWTKRAENP